VTLVPRGVVIEFDDAKGYGIVSDASTGARYFFHCTQIADSTRTTSAGTDFEFDVVAGRRGEWEAVALR
jgi:cold shock CspA family protein